MYVQLRLGPTTSVAYPLLLLPPTCHPFSKPSNSNLRPKPLGGNHTWPPLIHPINLANRLSSPPILKLQIKSPSHHICSSDEWKHFLAPLAIEKKFLWSPYQMVSFIILGTGDLPSSFLHLHCKCSSNPPDIWTMMPFIPYLKIPTNVITPQRPSIGAT